MLEDEGLEFIGARALFLLEAQESPLDQRYVNPVYILGIDLLDF